jgi:hypothetical protein
VERIIGYKPGAGGSSGAAFLKKVVDLTFFPELLDARTEIGVTGNATMITPQRSLCHSKSAAVRRQSDHDHSSCVAGVGLQPAPTPPDAFEGKE